MPWSVAQLNVDFNQNRATVELDSNTAPNNSITMNFQLADSIKSQILDDITKKAVLAQAKQVLTSAAGSL